MTFKSVPISKLQMFLVLISFSFNLYAQDKVQTKSYAPISMEPFADSRGHWYGIYDAGSIIQPKANQPKYPESEITKIADNILLYQRNNGGWAKNYDMQAILTKEQIDSLLNTKDQHHTTFDNSTTYTHVEYLAQVYTVTKIEKYKDACLKGINFILTAQYPNGGWPQYFPLEVKNYSSHITFNDGAFLGVMATMKKIKENNPMFSFLGKDIRDKASLAYDKGLECILKCQIKSNGRLTAWCQQHNEVDLQPAWARAYEMPSICNGESVQIVYMLMSIDHPDKRIIESIQSAIKWFSDSKILYTRVNTIPGPPEKSPYKMVTTDKIVVTDSTAPPIWTRFYEIGSERPLFSDRNSKLLYSMAEVSRERRAGYSWYTYAPQGALEKYPEWQKKWAPDNNVLVEKSPQLAFPGAEGFGRFVTGGRGGAVYEVTNLDDSGAGSLRDACSKTGARTIVFRVSGTIHLKSSLKIKEGNLTIAGQTAPGDGICIGGYETSISANNVIVRYIRFRLGNLNVAECECDAFGGRRISDVIIDHCSMSWSIDETGSFYDNTNFTMQWCLLSESLYNSGHKKGNHGYGGIQGGSGVSIHHNLYASHTSRNPRFSGGKYFASLGKKCLVDFRNNVIFNWGFNSVYGGENSQHNMINNYYKAGPATNENVKSRIVQVSRGNEPDPGKWYITGNYVTGFPAITADNWAGGVQGADANTAGVRMTVPFAFAPVTTQTPEDAYLSVLKNAGAILPKRDALDARIIDEVKSGTCAFGDTYDPKTGISKGHTGIINSQATVGGWPALKSAAAPKDSDKDGMPDTWEKSHGTNPNDAADGNKVGADGYTMLEVWLNKDKF